MSKEIEEIFFSSKMDRLEMLLSGRVPGLHTQDPAS